MVIIPKIIGTKIGMTRIFLKTGESLPVTVIGIKPNRVSFIKNTERDGYSAVQVTYGSQKASRINKPELGHFNKYGTKPGQYIKEFRIHPSLIKSVKLGDEFKANVFSEGDFVDIQGTSKGKGFQGVIKRHNFTMQPASHGNSLSHRVPGSTGQCQTPGRVFKGKKMPGQMGNKRCTVIKQEIVKVDTENEFILVKGSTPGSTGSLVTIFKSSRNKG